MHRQKQRLLPLTIISLSIIIFSCLIIPEMSYAGGEWDTDDFHNYLRTQVVVNKEKTKTFLSENVNKDNIKTLVECMMSRSLFNKDDKTEICGGIGHKSGKGARCKLTIEKAIAKKCVTELMGAMGEIRVLEPVAQKIRDGYREYRSRAYGDGSGTSDNAATVVLPSPAVSKETVQQSPKAVMPDISGGMPHVSEPTATLYGSSHVAQVQDVVERLKGALRTFNGTNKFFNWYAMFPAMQCWFDASDALGKRRRELFMASADALVQIARQQSISETGNISNLDVAIFEMMAKWLEDLYEKKLLVTSLASNKMRAQSTEDYARFLLFCVMYKHVRCDPVRGKPAQNAEWTLLSNYEFVNVYLRPIWISVESGGLPIPQVSMEACQHKPGRFGDFGFFMTEMVTSMETDCIDIEEERKGDLDLYFQAMRPYLLTVVKSQQLNKGSEYNEEQFLDYYYSPQKTETLGRYLNRLYMDRRGRNSDSSHTLANAVSCALLQFDFDKWQAINKHGMLVQLKTLHGFRAYFSSKLVQSDLRSTPSTIIAECRCTELLNFSLIEYAAWAKLSDSNGVVVNEDDLRLIVRHNIAAWIAHYEESIKDKRLTIEAKQLTTYSLSKGNYRDYRFEYVAVEYFYPALESSFSFGRKLLVELIQDFPVAFVPPVNSPVSVKQTYPASGVIAPTERHDLKQNTLLVGQPFKTALQEPAVSHAPANVTITQSVTAATTSEVVSTEPTTFIPITTIPTDCGGVIAGVYPGGQATHPQPPADVANYTGVSGSGYDQTLQQEPYNNSTAAYPLLAGLYNPSAAYPPGGYQATPPPPYSHTGADPAYPPQLGQLVYPPQPPVQQQPQEKINSPEVAVSLVQPPAGTQDGHSQNGGVEKKRKKDKSKRKTSAESSPVEDTESAGGVLAGFSEELRGDLTEELGEGDATTVFTRLQELKSQWRQVGKYLNVADPQLDHINRRQQYNEGGCLLKVIEQWLKDGFKNKKDQEALSEQYGSSKNWAALLDVVRVVDKSMAKSLCKKIFKVKLWSKAVQLTGENN